MTNDATISIDGKDYLLANLSEAARDQVGNVQATDAELRRLQVQVAIAQTARIAYANALKAELDKLA